MCKVSCWFYNGNAYIFLFLSDIIISNSELRKVARSGERMSYLSYMSSAQLFFTNSIKIARYLLYAEECYKISTCMPKPEVVLDSSFFGQMYEKYCQMQNRKCMPRAVFSVFYANYCKQ